MMTMLVAALALSLAAPAAAADKKVADAVARAESLIAKGRTDDAEKAMEKLVQQQPTAEAWTARSRLQHRIGNVEGAAASAAEAVKLAASAPPHVKADALAISAALDLERGTGMDALAHAREAATLAATPANLAVLARAQARVGDPAAVETAQKAIGADARSAAAHEALGHALLAARKGTDAAAAFRQALALEPRRASARTGLANALLAADKAAEAAAEAKKATEDDPRSAEAFAALGTATYAAAADKQAGWDDAIHEAQEGAFFNPRNPVVQLAVGRLFEAAGNLAQAEASYRRALDTDPGYGPAQIALLEIEARKGDVDAAIKRVRELLKQQPENGGLYLMLGRLLARKGQWPDAIEPLEKAARLLGTVAEAHALLGTAYQYTGRSDDALTAYTKAVELAPTNLEYLSTYGLLLGIAGQYTEATAVLEKVTRSPGYKDPAGWANLGWVNRNAEPPRAEEAIRAYENALRLDPKNVPATLGLGWACLTGKQYDQAIEWFHKAIALDPKVAAEAYYGIGWSYFFKRNIVQATGFAEKAKAAGRNVVALLENIEKYKKQGEIRVPPKVVQIDVGALCQQVQHGSVAARRSAARQLARAGSAGADCLVYAVRNDASLDVRLDAANALGNLGEAAGGEACIQLQGIFRGPNVYEAPPFATPEEMQNELKYGDLQKAAKAAIGRIGCN